MMRDKEREIQEIVSSVMEKVTGTISVSISLEQAKKLIEKVEDIYISPQNIPLMAMQYVTPMK